MKIVTALGPRRRLIAVLIAATLALGAWTWWGDSSRTTIRAQFTSAEGLHVDDDVKVLGVSVGQVTEIENRGDGVLVTLDVDASQPIPADARAAIVSPSLVSGRFVQLTPAWTQGERLVDGATIAVGRTTVPVTFDDVKQQLTDLAGTLGPARGAKGGTLAETILALEGSLEKGNSRLLRSALTELHDAAAALSDGRSDLFGTIANLDRFTRNLALNDAAVRGFTDELAAVSAVLAKNRATLRAALRDLARVLATTQKYLAKHHRGIVGTVRDLNLLAAAVADRSNELAGILHVAPHALIGLHNAIEDQAIATRASTTGFDNAAELVCGALLGAGATSQQCRAALEPIVALLGLAPGGAR